MSENISFNKGYFQKNGQLFDSFVCNDPSQNVVAYLSNLSHEVINLIGEGQEIGRLTTVYKQVDGIAMHSYAMLINTDANLYMEIAEYKDGLALYFWDFQLKAFTQVILFNIEDQEIIIPNVGKLSLQWDEFRRGVLSFVAMDNEELEMSILLYVKDAVCLQGYFDVHLGCIINGHQIRFLSEIFGEISLTLVEGNHFITEFIKNNALNYLCRIGWAIWSSEPDKFKKQLENFKTNLVTTLTFIKSLAGCAVGREQLVKKQEITTDEIKLNNFEEGL